MTKRKKAKAYQISTERRDWLDAINPDFGLGQGVGDEIEKLKKGWDFADFGTITGEGLKQSEDITTNKERE